MTLETTDIFDKTLDAFVDPDKRLIISYGGTSSSKTISIYQLLYLFALKNKNKRIAIIAESIPVIKRNVISDFKSHIFKETWNSNYFNKQDLLYSFPNGSIFQFLSGSNPDSFRGFRSDVAYFDEISNIYKDTYDQISMRCKDKILCSFNPTHEFYICDEMGRKDATIIKSKYTDNRFLSQNIINELEMKGKISPNFKRVYIDGEFGVAEGNIFKEKEDWFITEEMPKEYKWKVYGMDFGFSNDPTTLVEIRFYDDKLFIQQHIYSPGLLNQQIINYIREQKIDREIMADPSAPYHITEIGNAGINIKKGNNDIQLGIQNLKSYKMYVTRDSIDIIKELRNYAWKKDLNGKWLNQPIDLFNHSIDALRYAINEKIHNVKNSEGKMILI